MTRSLTGPVLPPLSHGAFGKRKKIMFPGHPPHKWERTVYMRRRLQGSESSSLINAPPLHRRDSVVSPTGVAILSHKGRPGDCLSHCPRDGEHPRLCMLRRAARTPLKTCAPSHLCSQLFLASAPRSDSAGTTPASGGSSKPHRGVRSVLHGFLPPGVPPHSTKPSEVHTQEQAQSKEPGQGRRHVPSLGLS